MHKDECAQELYELAEEDPKLAKALLETMKNIDEHDKHITRLYATITILTITGMLVSPYLLTPVWGILINGLFLFVATMLMIAIDTKTLTL
jgi:hypothetical protein